MSLIIILLVGAVLGWLASIVMQVERRERVAANICVGVAGAFVCGGMASSMSILAGLTPECLGAAFAGATTALAIVTLARRSAGRRQDRRSRR